MKFKFLFVLMFPMIVGVAFATKADDVDATVKALETKFKPLETIINKALALDVFPGKNLDQLLASDALPAGGIPDVNVNAILTVVNDEILKWGGTSIDISQELNKHSAIIAVKKAFKTLETLEGSAVGPQKKQLTPLVTELRKLMTP